MKRLFGLFFGASLISSGTIALEADGCSEPEAPISTTSVKMQIFVDRTAPLKQNLNAQTFKSAERTSNFSTKHIFYGTLGEMHLVQVFFNHTHRNTWAFNVLVGGAHLANYKGLSGDDPVIISSGEMTFNSNDAIEKLSIELSGEEDSSGLIGTGQRITPDAAHGIQWSGSSMVPKIEYDFGQKLPGHSLASSSNSSFSLPNYFSQNGKFKTDCK